MGLMFNMVRMCTNMDYAFTNMKYAFTNMNDTWMKLMCLTRQKIFTVTLSLSAQHFSSFDGDDKKEFTAQLIL